MQKALGIRRRAGRTACLATIAFAKSDLIRHAIPRRAAGCDGAGRWATSDGRVD